MRELENLGKRIRRQRIAMQLKQRDLADKAAVSLDVISSLENGRSITTESLARVLRAMDHKDALEDMLPLPVASPIDLQKRAGKQRQRVR